MRSFQLASTSLLLLALAAGCGPAGADIRRPTVTTLPSSVPASPDQPRQITSGTLPAATYATTAFRPKLTFSLSDGWFSLFPDDTDEIAFERDGYTQGFYISRVAQVVDPFTAQAIDAPVDLVAWLSANPAFEVVGTPTETIVGGLAARVIVLDVVGAPESEIFAYETGNTRVHPGSRFRYTVDGNRWWPGPRPDLLRNVA